MKIEDFNSALMQTTFARLFAARAGTIKIACVNRGKVCTFGDLSLFLKGIFTKQTPLRSRGGGVSFRMPAL